MKKVLLIEDDHEIRENIAELLELSKYKVIMAENGKLGVKLAQNESPDIILCDIMMPILDGYGVLHILNRNSDTSRIPFIFLTAKTGRSDYRKGMSLGADDYLIKPFDDKDLLEAVESRLKKVECFKKAGGSKKDELSKFERDAGGFKALKEILKKKSLRRYKKKNGIYWEGDYANALLLIHSGKVKTYKTNQSGKKLITGIHGKGTFIGFNALLTDSPYNESAITITDSEVYAISRNDFFQLLYDNKGVANTFIEMLSNKLKDKEERMLHMAYDSVRQRAAEALITLNKQKEKNEFGISIGREDLANIVGTAPESVIRTLSSFKREALIAIQAKLIKVLDSEKLNNIALRGY